MTAAAAMTNARAYQTLGKYDPGSVRIAIAPEQRECPQDDFKIEPHGPVLEVFEIELDPFCHRVQIISSAMAVDLRPTGDSGFHLVPEHVAGNQAAVTLVHRYRVWTRAHQAHAPLENIEQLRQLIQ